MQGQPVVQQLMKRAKSTKGPARLLALHNHGKDKCYGLDFAVKHFASLREAGVRYIFFEQPASAVDRLKELVNKVSPQQLLNQVPKERQRNMQVTVTLCQLAAQCGIEVYGVDTNKFSGLSLQQRILRRDGYMAKQVKRLAGGQGFLMIAGNYHAGLSEAIGAKAFYVDAGKPNVVTGEGAARGLSGDVPEHVISSDAAWAEIDTHMKTVTTAVTLEPIPLKKGHSSMAACVVMTLLATAATAAVAWMCSDAEPS